MFLKLPRRPEEKIFRLAAGKQTAAGFGQTADLPVRLDGVVEPGFRPAFFDSALDGAFAEALADVIEKRQLPARLV